MVIHYLHSSEDRKFPKWKWYVEWAYRPINPNWGFRILIWSKSQIIDSITQNLREIKIGDFRGYQNGLIWHVLSTACPISNFHGRNWNNSKTMHFWPLVVKAKMCLRRKQFVYIFSCLFTKNLWNCSDLRLYPLWVRNA